jgi:hypothetical protein
MAVIRPAEKRRLTDGPKPTRGEVMRFRTVGVKVKAMRRRTTATTLVVNRLFKRAKSPVTLKSASNNPPIVMEV